MLTRAVGGTQTFENGPTTDANGTAGKVTLQFSGRRRPRPGEVYALIRAENAVIANLATFKVAGARGAFDVVEDDFGIVIVFK